MLQISYAGLSLVISAQSPVEICVVAWNRKKITTNPISGF